MELELSMALEDGFQRSCNNEKIELTQQNTGNHVDSHLCSPILEFQPVTQQFELCHLQERPPINSNYRTEGDKQRRIQRGQIIIIMLTYESTFLWVWNTHVNTYGIHVWYTCKHILGQQINVVVLGQRSHFKTTN